MIDIDGAQGEGGGQIVRNACALSLVTGIPFRLHSIRAGRDKPGLMRQHLTAVEAACAIGKAECDGLTLGAREIIFRPGRVTPGDYRFAIGTAGSTGLVLQTILMPLVLAGGPSRLVLEGGTHNMQAPPFEFVDRVFLSLVNRMGPTVEARLVRHGFYPRGGGRLEVTITPARLTPIECIDRGRLLRTAVTAVRAAVPEDVTDRELKAARGVLEDWPLTSFQTAEVPEDQGPGNIVLLEAEFENVTEIFSGFGSLGVSAERVAVGAARRMAGYLRSSAFAGPYLVDQLLLPFALAGAGCLTTVKPSNHARTAAALIEPFTGRQCRFEHRATGEHLLTVS